MNNALLLLAAVGIAVLGFLAGFLAGFAAAPATPADPPSASPEGALRYADLEVRLAELIDERASLSSRVADLEMALADETTRVPASPGATPLQRIRRLATREGTNEILRALVREFWAGDLTELDLRNFLADPGREDVLVAGVNDRNLPDHLRGLLLEAATDVNEPLAVLGRINIPGEPDPKFLEAMARILRAEVDRGNEKGALDVFEALLQRARWSTAGWNVLHVYVGLAQMASRGNDRAASHVRRFLGPHDPSSEGALRRGLRALLRPPATAENGKPLRGTLITYVDPRVHGLEAGEIVTRVGDEPVTDSRTFYSALARWKARAGEQRVEVRVLVLDHDDPSRYRAKTRKIVVRGFRRVYEACSIAAN